ncbi:MAG: aminoglycoside phosphotransferase family protein [Clostridia bacterium]|nr:aminoglycoside phosphotransferase family protein [Clostridia bacterium]
MSITKNRQSEETIRRMAKAAFPDKTPASVTELTEGLCNAAYRIGFTDGSQSILKIAAGDTSGYLSNEIRMMDAEVMAMEMLRDTDGVRVAGVQYYDDSKTICSGSYFFMEVLEGLSCSSLRWQLTEEENNTLDYESGQIERAVSELTFHRFGFIASAEHQYDSLYEFVHKLFENVLSDMKARDIPMEPGEDEIFTLLQRDKPYFDEVTQARLTHWDMWDGNVLVKDGHISGIIDWERALWAEPLMDERFRNNRNAHFMRGYGQSELTPAEQRRRVWYDLLVALTTKAEAVYRAYGTPETTAWVRSMIDAAYGELSSC